MTDKTDCGTPINDGLDEFTEYFIRNYPPDTIISNPNWHAPKIYRAATRTLERENAELRRQLADERRRVVPPLVIRTLERMANKTNWNEDECILKRAEKAGETHGIFMYSWGVKPWLAAQEALDAIRALADPQQPTQEPRK